VGAVRVLETIARCIKSSRGRCGRCSAAEQPWSSDVLRRLKLAFLMLTHSESVMDGRA
jgi:hypothetical protein